MLDWVGIGCVKCGTSWLWRELRKHPQVYAPRVKEVMYFNSAGTKSRSWYRQFFAEALPGQKVGEFTPDYFHHYESPYRLRDEFPSAKLIVCFRHPVERAFSNWKHAVQAGRFGGTFREAFNFWRVRERGIYSKYLRRWLRLFPAPQMKVVWYDDIRSRPAETLKEVYGFLGVDDTFLSPDYKDWYRFKYHRDESLTGATMSNEDRYFWLDFYRPHTAELEAMSDRDLSPWRA